VHVRPARPVPCINAAGPARHVTACKYTYCTPRKKNQREQSCTTTYVHGRSGRLRINVPGVHNVTRKTQASTSTHVLYVTLPWKIIRACVRLKAVFRPVLEYIFALVLWYWYAGYVHLYLYCCRSASYAFSSSRTRARAPQQRRGDAIPPPHHICMASLLMGLFFL
jgi:hypothetical protein